MTKDFFEKLKVGQMLELKESLIPALNGENVYLKVTGELEGRTSRDGLEMQVYWYDQYVCSISAMLGTDDQIVWMS